jgi:hypothetical protein
MEKFFKNPVYMGVVAVVTLAIVLLWVWDDKKNPNQDFFGLLKKPTV